jgi:asparagine synthase (glutamine-hydrolysing)
MCGFAIVIESTENRFADYSKIALKTIKYRGLEQSTFKCLEIGNKKISIYHERLVTFGSEKYGLQPLYTSDQIVLFNGAIYNYLELAARYGFDSQNSDTEVLKCLIERGGFDPSAIDGMYAVCILDKSKMRVSLYRDRFGEKPLYYSCCKKKVVISSSLHFVRDVKGEKKISAKEVARYITVGPMNRQPDTDFSTVQSVMPNSQVEINWENGAVSRRDITFQRPVRKLGSEAEDLIIESLLNSIEKRTRGQHRYCLGLSGGVDSSVLAAGLRCLYPYQEIFSVSNIYEKTDPYNDEGDQIRRTGKALKLCQLFVEPDLEFVISNLDKMLSVMDFCPFNTCMSGWATYAMMKKHGFRVSLEGQGADELFAGYQPYVSNYISSNSKVLGMVCDSVAFRFGIKGRESNKIILKGIAGFFLKRYNFAKQAHRFGLKVQRSVNYICQDIDDVLNHDQLNNLSILLSYGDKSSMYFNIEQRFPYLCGKVVETVNSTRIEKLINRNGTKQVLRSIARRLGVPEEVAYQKKKLGWPIPEKIWMQDGLADYMKNQLKVSESPFLESFILEKDVSRKIRIYMFSRWVQIHGLEVRYDD